MDLILHNQVVPAVNQIETHPFCQQTEAQKFLQENKVQIQSWAPFAEGHNNMFGNEVLLSIAEKHKKSIARIILRWLVQRGVVVIPKSVHAERITENFDIFSFELGSEDMEAISTLDLKKSAFLDHRDPQTVKWMAGVKAGA
jgi:diketogulonate reductase-like aldo/keto reductase